MRPRSYTIYHFVVEIHRLQHTLLGVVPQKVNVKLADALEVTQLQLVLELLDAIPANAFYGWKVVGMLQQLLRQPCEEVVDHLPTFLQLCHILELGLFLLFVVRP